MAKFFGFVLLVSFILSFNSCSSGKSAKPAKKKKNYPKIIAELQKTTERLVKENKELKFEVSELKKILGSKSDSGSKDTIELKEIISLLEKNLTILSEKQKELRFQLTQYKNEKSALNYNNQGENINRKENKHQTQAIEEDKLLYEKEIITPERSKAIESVTLLPAKQKKTIKKKTRIEKPEKTKSKIQPEKTSEISDPDLTSPTTPIQLRLEYGAKNLYNRAYKAFSSGDLKGAINLFKQFLDKYPNDYDSDNAQFWIGFSYQKLKSSIEAEEAFRKVLRNYEHGPTLEGFKTADAILMIGRIYLKRNKKEHAKFYFQDLLSRFPNSRAAYKADLELKSLKGVGKG